MQEPCQSTLPYRPCVGIMLVNKQGLVWHGERIDTPGAWQMPQGGVDDGEDILEAAYRELEEETGINRNHVELITKAPNDLTYDLPPNLLKTLWKGRYRGQSQTWFLMRLLVDDGVINIETDIPEFAQWRWGSINELPGLIVPFKRHIYQTLIKEFGPLITS